LAAVADAVRRLQLGSAMSFSFVGVVRRISIVVVVAAFLLATALASRAAAGTEVGVVDAKTTMPGSRAARTLDATARTTLGTEPRGMYSSKPIKLGAGVGELMAFPPSKTARTRAGRPMSVIYLHGARGRVESGCPWFRSGASELGWLVCPEAVEHQPDGSRSWGADVFEQSPIVVRALRAAEANGASPEPGVAVGFSQGSYVALDLVKARLAKFRGLVLLGAELHPNAKTLRDAGVQRVALGAGQLDATHASLVEEARRLDDEGLETRFFDLGRVGHTYAADDPAVLREAIAWAGGLE
jgi:predicted esterase